jgi:hypothetical protein
LNARAPALQTAAEIRPGTRELEQFLRRAVKTMSR